MAQIQINGISVDNPYKAKYENFIGGKWVGGVIQGEFNDKATIGQIFVDAAISMFPIAGEVTAARDLVAILLRMVDDKKQASDVINWIKIILCLLPIIPIFGGILKGIGRLLITVIKDTNRRRCLNPSSSILTLSTCW